MPLVKYFFLQKKIEKGILKKMTVLDISVELLKWFQTNDVIDAEKDLKKIILISENETQDKALLLAGLIHLESKEIITNIKIQDSDLYFLNKNLDSLDQNINIDQETATKVSQVINRFCDSIEDHKDVSDPTDIKQKDILHLALILEAWQNNKNNNTLDQ